MGGGLKQNNMKQTNFRIGNFILFKGKTQIITAFTLHNISKFPNDFELININEEWLFHFGFVEKYPLGVDFTPEEYNFRIFKLNDFEIEIDLSNNIIQLQNFLNITLLDYKYIHELQNLYFILVGKELVLS